MYTYIHIHVGHGYLISYTNAMYGNYHSDASCVFSRPDCGCLISPVSCIMPLLPEILNLFLFVSFVQVYNVYDIMCTMPLLPKILNLFLFFSFVQVVDGTFSANNSFTKYTILLILVSPPLVLWCCQSSFHQGEVLDLGQAANWTVSSSRVNISVPASVPGGIYSDLRQVRSHTVFFQELTFHLRRVFWTKNCTTGSTMLSTGIWSPR